MRKVSFIFFLVVFLFFQAGEGICQKYGIYKTELENGLDVIVIENSIVPLVTIEIDVKNGAYTESPEYDGLSHLYEHMFFKANEVIPSQEEYIDRLNELGAVWNGTTSEERVNYFFTLPKDSLAAGLEFMYNAISSPLFLEEELEKERPVVTGEYDRAESNPFFHLFRGVEREVWWKYFSRKNTIGDREVILSTTPEKLKTIQNRYYVPNNSALLMAGDVTAEQGFRLAEEYFSEWRRGADPFEAHPVPEHPPVKQTDTLFVEQPVNVMSMMIEWQGPSVSDDRSATFAADVLSYILGQQTTRFYKNLVESGLAYSVNFSYYTLDHTGPITIFAQTSAENLKALQNAIFKELENMESPDYFTKEQLENAKTILAINEKYGREEPSEFVHTVGFWWAVAGLDYYLNYVENLKRVTTGDIQRFLKTYILGKPYIMGVLVSLEQKEELGL